MKRLGPFGARAWTPCRSHPGPLFLPNFFKIAIHTPDTTITARILKRAASPALRKSGETEGGVESGSGPLRIREDLTLPTSTTNSCRLRVRLKLLGFLLLFSTIGCSHQRCGCEEHLAQRILPPMDVDNHEEFPAQFRQPKAADEPDTKEARLSTPAQGRGVAREPTQNLTLAEAIDLAFRQQPRLRVYLETVEQARRGEDIAFAPFLPLAVAGYSVGGFDLNAGGLSVIPGVPPGFTFIPALGAVPIGLNIHTGYELADLKLQWLICDFGRRLGRYRQAGLAVDIAQLQSERAYQTVANEVAVG